MKQHRETKKTKQYQSIIKSFKGIPENRMDPTEPNLKWFIRQGAALNINEPRLLEAIVLAKSLLNNEGNYTNNEYQ